MGRGGGGPQVPDLREGRWWGRGGAGHRGDGGQWQDAAETVTQSTPRRCRLGYGRGGGRTDSDTGGGGGGLAYRGDADSDLGPLQDGPLQRARGEEQVRGRAGGRLEGYNEPVLGVD